ncbi:aldehyde dehydrogenase family protein [Lentzea tibetensis]|uniref:aldehyde dehydrogenase family protein n=1 Tax=Lentzea tibetensis TaxID=2591470 RepID=UPI0016441937|nr:aldehyde dehydrogenase family protein [Lentzea tibetensis]
MSPTLDTASRLDVISTICQRVLDRAADLEDAAVRLLPFPRQVIRADLALAASRLEAFATVTPRLAGRRPLGRVALALPGNAILSNPLATIAASHLAGNKTLVRMPRQRREWAAVLSALVGEAAEFVDFGGSGFIDHAMRQPDVDAIMVFGDDSWAADYEMVARTTGTKFVFEGPGKDPFLVLCPALVDEAARAAVEAGMFNAGQACTSPERFYVVPAAYDDFVERVIDLVRELNVGDPDDPQTQIGPLAPVVAHRLDAQVRDAISKGAVVLNTGMARPMTVNGEERVLVPPIVVAGTDHRMTLMREETFGPVIAIQRAASIHEALELAEDSPYGLSATTFGRVEGVAERLVHSHGQVFAEQTWLSQRRRHPLAPYGGRRRSGWVWEWQDEQFVRRDGPRHNFLEFSRI